MIPLTLELTNFLSYRDTAVLDFENIHLACISGANGAGKSSILDGITWALFGRSRSKSDDDLVNRLAALGGAGAEVKLTFLLEAITYRVIRRKKPRKGTLLELQIKSDTGKWKALSESKVRDTQAAIERLLRMNYDTFINASFLLQGKADEFTTKTPNRRKEILADLLGVSQWEEYKEAAAVRRKQSEGRIALLDGLLEEITLELEKEPEREAALSQVRTQLALVESRVADKEALLQQLRRAETAVKQQERMVKNLADNLAAAQGRLESAQATRQKRQAERDAFQQILDDAESITAAYDSWKGAEALVQEWQRKADAYHRLQREGQPHELEIARSRSRLEQRQKELEAGSRQAADAQDERQQVIETQAASSQRLSQLEEALRQLRQQEQAWHQARADLQQLESDRQALAQELERLQSEVRRTEGLQREQAGLLADGPRSEAMLAELTGRIAVLTDESQGAAAARAELDALEGEQPRLRMQMDKLKGRIDQLETQSGGSCPLCGQTLSDSHRKSVLKELKEVGKESGDRFRANKKRSEFLNVELARLESRIKDLPGLERERQAQAQLRARAEARQNEITQAIAAWEASGSGTRQQQLQAALADQSAVTVVQERVTALETAVQQQGELEKERQEQQRQFSSAEARLGEIDRIRQEWTETGQAALAKVKQQLDENDFALGAQQALAGLIDQMAQLDYQPNAHETAKEKRNLLEQAAARYHEMQQAQAAVKPLEDSLADLDVQIAALLETAAELTEQHQSAAEELRLISADSGDLKGVEAEVFRLREEQIDTNRRLAVAQQSLSVLDDQRARYQRLTAERAEVTLLVSRIKMLEKACGRDGVQALLIEQALPDIEDRANELLDRLTGGDMRVNFETQKQLKSRDAVAETLDIRIIDHAGERPYANFSGGEQFRVNFAIRLALSQLLAKRAGARLQTLVIDEGFGSQDPVGRQRLVEAINMISDEFARILVITHVDELRDAFPTRIEVDKGVSGSRIVVS